MANKYKDLKTADTLTTMSPYITSQWTRHQTSSSLEINPRWTWPPVSLRARRGRNVERKILKSLIFAEYKAKIILSGALLYWADKERSAPVSPVCYHSVWLVWPVEPAQVGNKGSWRDREREGERETAFLSGSTGDTSFTLYCYTNYDIHVCLLSTSFYNYNFLSRPTPTTSKRFLVTVGPCFRPSYSEVFRIPQGQRKYNPGNLEQ